MGIPDLKARLEYWLSRDNKISFFEIYVFFLRGEGLGLVVVCAGCICSIS